MEIDKALDFFMIRTSGNVAERFSEASTMQCGVAFRLMMFCARHPAGGVIYGAGGWSRKQLGKRLDLTPKEIAADCPGLWHWEGEDLYVDAYNVEAEAKCIDKRQKLAEAGRISGQARREAAAAEEERKPKCPQDVYEVMQPILEGVFEDEQIMTAAREFFAKNTTRNWMNEKGLKIVDWKAIARVTAQSLREKWKSPF